MGSQIGFTQRLKEFIEIQTFLSVFRFVVSKTTDYKVSKNEWLSILSDMHEKGMLYYGKDGTKINVVVGAYRIKEFSEDRKNIIPEKEEGDILYVNFAVSDSNSILFFNKLKRAYLKEHPNVREIIFYERGNEKNLKRFKVGVKNERQTRPSRRTSVRKRPNSEASATGPSSTR